MVTNTTNQGATLSQAASPRKGIILALLAATQFMIVLDGLIVNVALPSIQGALKFSPQNLQWVVNAYTLMFGGFLLLGGRIADLFGRRRVFVAGLVLFSVASLVGGFAQSDLWLIIARAVQGLGGALISPAALSLLTTIFEEGPERDRALGVFGSTAGSGAACGVLLGGILTQFLGWEWILFLNFPIGLVVALLSLRFLPKSEAPTGDRSFDILGALTITGGLVMLVYALVQTNENGWTSLSTILLFGGAIVLIGLFIFIETRLKSPLVQFTIFRIRSVTAANIIALLFSCCLGGTIFLLSLYLQVVLRYSPLESGLAFLPFALGTIVASIIASRLVSRFGIRPVLAVGLVLLATGTLLLAQIPPDGNFLANVLPGSVIFAFGLTGSAIPITIAAVTGITGAQAGLASGLINTTQQIGFALGLAILSTVATARTTDYAHTTGTPANSPTALTSGFQLAFWVAFGFAVVGLLLTLRLFSNRQTAPVETSQPENEHRSTEVPTL